MALRNYFSDDSDDEFFALELSPLIRRRIRHRQNQQRREMWVNHINAKRNEFGEFSHLWNDLQIDDDHHFSYFRMRKDTFQYILDNIHSKLETFCNFRETISPRERLVVTLRHRTSIEEFSSKEPAAIRRSPHGMPPTRKGPSSEKKKIKDGESSGDEEYRKKRDRNNMAVKRSRVKSRMKTQETMERVDQLKRENDQLVEKINLMSKELSFLKELFIAQASSTGIPSNVDLDQLFADSEPITDTKPDFFDNLK